jgi:hypothetical protein
LRIAGHRGVGGKCLLPASKAGGGWVCRGLDRARHRAAERHARIAQCHQAEQYADLAASAHFRDLRFQLIATEERIAASRRFFNLAVGEYNATLARFPANLVAARRRFAERRPFDLGIERLVLDEPVAIRFS